MAAAYRLAQGQASSKPSRSAHPHVPWSVEDSEVEELDLDNIAGKNKFACVLHGVFTPEECQAMVDRSEGDPDGFQAALINSGGGKQKVMLDIRNNDRCMIDDPSHAEFMYQRVLAVLRHHDRGEENRGAGTDHQPTPNKATDKAAGSRSKGASNKGVFGWFSSGPAVTHDSSLLARFLNPPWTGSRPFHAVGLNERLRFLRYDGGTYFAPHFDGQYIRGEDGERQGERSYVTFQLYLNDGFEGGATRFMNGYDESIGIDVVPRTGSVLLFEHAMLHEGSMLVSGRKYALRTDIMYSLKKGQEYAVTPIVMPAKTKTATKTPVAAAEEEDDDEHGAEAEADEQAASKQAGSFQVAESEKMASSTKQSVVETLGSFMSSGQSQSPPQSPPRVSATAHAAAFDFQSIQKAKANPEAGGLGDPYS
mmetsp:Transcript_83768/g.236610  ORF Transcript_83768/g.236610 Transcript_83768/m.236610 type:complete len:422 (-) Transcript_83768:169-1434(-)